MGAMRCLDIYTPIDVMQVYFFLLVHDLLSSLVHPMITHILPLVASNLPITNLGMASVHNPRSVHPHVLLFNHANFLCNVMYM